MKWSLSGANAFLLIASQGWKNVLVRVAPGLSPHSSSSRLKPWSTTDLVQPLQQSGLVASISGSTLWRWLHEDAIRPWYHRSWVFPRDPDFATQAGRVLDCTPASGKAASILSSAE